MNWEDLHVAFKVSQEKTVSGAARVLGVHHATVIRHVDRLEEALGEKLFLRNAKGYEVTDAGQALFNVAAVASEQFSAARARIEDRDDELTGKIVITTLPSLAVLFMPAFENFHAKYPEVRIRVETSLRLYRLEFGEAHLAIRAGAKPQDADNIPVHLMDLQTALYSSQDYLERHGKFDGEHANGHFFVSASDENARAPYNLWLRENGFDKHMVFDTQSDSAQISAVCAGLGLGFMNVFRGQQNGLVEHLPAREEWRSPIWQVTHRDMHRSAKVQAMSECLKDFIGQL